MADRKEKITVLVLGDYNCGKTSLCHWLEHNCSALRTPCSTVGCNVCCFEIGFNNPPYIVDLRDIGGHRNFSSSRAVFMHDFDGVIIVYDASKYDEVSRPEKKWIQEIENSTTSKQPIFDVESGKYKNFQDKLEHNWVQGLDNYVPLLVVGNKIDLLQDPTLQRYTNRKDVEFVSTFDPQFNPRKFQDFFHLTFKHKFGGTEVETSTSKMRSFKKKSSYEV